MRFAQLVMGPAGCGKSTYCSYIEQHAQVTKRKIEIVNLDPAAEQFNYQPLADIRELISVDDVMEEEELKLGPNGGLIYCLEFLMSNIDWLEEQIGGSEIEDDYVIFDCPGQIELYTHLSFLQNFIKTLESWGFRICGIFALDAHFLTDSTKFISGAMTALSTMVNLEIPHVNLLTKMDLLSKKERKKIERFLEPDAEELLLDEEENEWNTKFLQLTQAIAKVLDDFSLVKFFPLNITKENQIENLLLMIDMTIGVSENADVKVKDYDQDDPETEENTDNNYGG